MGGPLGDGSTASRGGEGGCRGSGGQGQQGPPFSWGPLAGALASHSLELGIARNYTRNFLELLGITTIIPGIPMNYYDYARITTRNY